MIYCHLQICQSEQTWTEDSNSSHWFRDGSWISQCQPLTTLFLKHICFSLSYFHHRESDLRWGNGGRKSEQSRITCTSENCCSLLNVRPLSPPHPHSWQLGEISSVTLTKRDFSSLSILSRGCYGIMWPFHFCIAEPRDWARERESKRLHADLQSWEVRPTSSCWRCDTCDRHDPKPTTPSKGKLNSQSWCTVLWLCNQWNQLHPRYMTSAQKPPACSSKEAVWGGLASVLLLL